MKRSIKIILLITTLIVIGILNNCTEPPKDGRIILENNTSTLSSRVSYVNEVIEIDTTIQTGGLGKAASNPVSLTLIAEVDPPHYRQAGSPGNRYLYQVQQGLCFL